jgi:hypothetical protein
MDREKALDYIETASEHHAKDLTKYYIDEAYDIKTIRKEMDYYEKVMEYVRENLK